MKHAPIESADYQADLVYRSTGRAIRAGAFTVATSCTSVGIALGCF